LTPSEEAEGVRVPVDCSPIREGKLFGNGCGAGPVDKFSLDLFAIFVSAD